MPTAPFELLSGPVTMWTAAVNTAAPEISATPVSAWELLGQNGDKSYGDDGVTITPDQTIEEQMVLGSTAAQKAFRTEEHLSLTVMLLDVTAENLAKVMNGAAVTDTAAVSGVSGGHRSFDLLRGFDVNEFAALVKGFSPYGDNMSAQYWLPRAYIMSVGEVSYVKGEAAGTEIEIMALEHSSNGFGKYYAQDA